MPNDSAHVPFPQACLLRSPPPVAMKKRMIRWPMILNGRHSPICGCYCGKSNISVRKVDSLGKPARGRETDQSAQALPASRRRIHRVQDLPECCAREGSLLEALEQVIRRLARRLRKPFDEIDRLTVVQAVAILNEQAPEAGDATPLDETEPEEQGERRHFGFPLGIQAFIDETLALIPRHSCRELNPTPA